MSVEHALLDALRTLAPEKQAEVLDFAEFLKAKNEVKRPLRSVKGLCADVGASITAEDIDEARREMWRAFPGEVL